MTIATPIFIFILGTIIGSFLNVVILRYNTGRSIGGRSGCMHCNYQLRWYDLIPILSWVFLRGKCRKCGSKISAQYPLVELATGLIFVSVFFQTMNESIFILNTVWFLIWNFVIFSILIVIFVYDLKHKIIPDELSYSFAALTFAQAVATTSFNQPLTTLNILDLLSGIILFAFFWTLWKVSDGRWIGLGDGKLALGIGWYLGFVYGLSALIMAFWIGAVFSLIILFIDQLNRHSKNITMKTEIPFAPFLIIGLLLEFFFRIDLLGLGLFFN